VDNPDLAAAAPATVAMIDATHANLARLPANVAAALAKVCGYDSGTGDIEWTIPDWARFPKAGHVLLEQGYTWTPAQILTATGFDVENKAVTPLMAAAGVKERIANGIQWTLIYGSDGWLAAVEAALKALGPSWYFGHVECFLANWNLSEAQAAALLGTLIHGMTCRAVQWASPTSNPATVIPGTTLTLAEAQVDLSVTEAAWHAYVAPVAPSPWQAQALAIANGLAADLSGLKNLLAAHQ
jgi:hypothetical protein